MRTKSVDKQKMEKFKDYINVNTKMLKYMGLTVGVDENKRDKKSMIMERLITIVTNFVCIMDAFFQILWIKDIWKEDNDLVMQITTSGISNIVCICKGLRLAFCREDLQTIFEELEKVWEKYSPSIVIHKEILLKANKTVLFCKCYISMMIGLGICFAMPPIKNILFQYINRKATNSTYDLTERVFLVRYPFEINSLSIYFTILLVEMWILFCTALYWVCCDTLFAQLTTHTSLQFQILQHDIEIATNHKDNEILLENNVIDFVKRHRNLLNICEMIEKIFSPVLFTTMLLTSINICVNLIELRMMVMEHRFSEALLHMFHLINIFFQLLVYCVFAERLTQQSISIANATYNCKWPEKGYKLRVYFQLLIMKSQKPFYCTAYGFFTIGHNRITSILNRAMSFYMMLTATN